MCALLEGACCFDSHLFSAGFLTWLLPFSYACNVSMCLTRRCEEAMSVQLTFVTRTKRWRACNCEHIARSASLAWRLLMWVWRVVSMLPDHFEYCDACMKACPLSTVACFMDMHVIQPMWVCTFFRCSWKEKRTTLRRLSLHEYNALRDICAFLIHRVVWFDSHKSSAYPAFECCILLANSEC